MHIILSRNVRTYIEVRFTADDYLNCSSILPFSPHYFSYFPLHICFIIETVYFSCPGTGELTLLDTLNSVLCPLNLIIS